MTRIVWDKVLPVEVGLDQGVFYTPSGEGHAWNGLISVDGLYSGTDGTIQYIDGQKVHKRRRDGDFEGTIRAFTYPDIFYSSVLLNRRRPTFSMSYRTTIENESLLHLVYNILVAPSDTSWKHETPVEFSWDFTTRPTNVPEFKASSHIVVHTGISNQDALATLEDILYGSEVAVARMPSVAEVKTIFEAYAQLVVVDNGDGSFTVTGPDSAITMLDATTFQIDWPSAIYIYSDTYRISTF